MANLSNINNKFIVQDNSRILVNKTSDTGATLQVGGSLSTDGSVRAGNGVLYVGDGGTAVCRIMGYGDYEMITGVSGATYLRVSGSSILAGTLQDGQYILATGLAYGAVNNYTQIINGSTGAITGTTATFSGSVTAVGISSTIASATSGYFATGTAIPANQILHVRDNVGQVATNSAGGIKISSSPGNDVFLLKRNDGGTSYFALQNSSASEFITVNMASGNVGIGTPGPVNKLGIQVAANSNTKAINIYSLNTSPNSYTSIGSQYSISNTYVESEIRFGNETQSGGGSYLGFVAGGLNSGNTEKMRITSAGNVGIGTESPGSYDGESDDLVVFNSTTPGITIATDDTGSRGALRFADGTSGNERYRGAVEYNHNGDDMSFRTAGTQKMTLTDAGNLLITNGNVGIGTTSPGRGLTIDKSNANAALEIIKKNTTNQIVYLGTGSSGGTDDPLLRMFHNTTENIRLYTTGDSWINGGNVGIGTTSPTNGKFVINQESSAASFGGNVCQLFENFSTTDGQMMSIGFRNNNSVGTTAYIDAVAYDQSIGATDIRFSTYSGSAWNSNMVTFQHTGRVGIGTTQPNYNLEIGGTASPVVAIVSNINSSTSSLYFGDSDAKDRGQIRYTHFGDFMELKAGGATRVYIESGINTAYTSDGLFNSNATPSYWNHGNGQFKLGYMDNGSGLYSGAYAFNVKSTDGIPVTGREIGAIYINDTSNGRKPLIISNQGRITMDQTNTSLANSNTGWLTIANGTSAYNFYNAYTGTDGGSGCARYRLNNTSPSFFDFYYTTTQVGYITTNGTDIFYANTSDYRLKEDLKSFDGMSLLEQIQVYDFKWKESDNRMYGVVAHELQEVVPQAVVGNKDEEKLQAVDYSKLVPILIKSIQELKAEIELLKNS